VSVGKKSYKATGSIREFRITVCQYPRREDDPKKHLGPTTRLGVTWSTREEGDNVGQGHLWCYSEEYPKQIKSLAHAVNLAVWLTRRALAGQWEQRR